MDSQFKTELLIFKTDILTDKEMGLEEDKLGVIRMEIVLTQIYRTVELLILSGMVLMIFWLVRILKTHFAKKRIDEERVLKRTLQILARTSAPDSPVRMTRTSRVISV